MHCAVPRGVSCSTLNALLLAKAAKSQTMVLCSHWVGSPANSDAWPCLDCECVSCFTASSETATFHRGWQRVTVFHPADFPETGKPYVARESMGRLADCLLAVEHPALNVAVI